jgi:hypothetical protein
MLVTGTSSTPAAWATVVTHMLKSNAPVKSLTINVVIDFAISSTP